MNMKPKKMKLDIVTRWSSLYVMLDRYVSYIEPINKALLKIDSDLILNQKEYEVIV